MTVNLGKKLNSELPEIKVVYIGGSSRSGTGILGRVFSIITGSAHGGELRRLWSHGLRPGRTCDCGRPHEECPIWTQVLMPGASYLEPSLAEIGAVQRTVAPSTHAWWYALKILFRRSQPAPFSVEARYLELYSDLYRAFAHAAHSSIILDNSKNPADAALLATASDVMVYCVHIVRDPRGVLFSFRKRSSPNDPSRFRPIETVKIAVYWTLRQLTFDAIRRRYGKKRSLMVIYEQLMENPDQSLQAACRMLGEDEPTEELHTGIPLTMPEVHGPDGSSKQRFKSTKVILREDDRWRSELHPADRILMTTLTLPFLLRYHYPIRMKSTSPVDGVISVESTQ